MNDGIVKILRGILLLSVPILLHFSAKAQLSVSITGNFEGCAPQILTFGCNITGAEGEVSYSWSSGNGDVSLLAEPTFSYISSGRYNLSVTVECNGQTATASHEVVVFNGPTALFNDSAVVACVPYLHRFRSLSEAGDAEITQWHWYFGDGVSALGENRYRTYTSPGIFTVSLEVTDANGCTDIMHSQMLTLSKKPEVSIAASDAMWCVAPHEVDFTSEISTDVGLGGPYEATWDFGDGETSNEDDPSHTYTLTGQFDVSLTVVDSYGCQTVVRNDVMVEIGTFSPNCVVPEEVCLNTTTTFRSDANEVNSLWNFGDGSAPQLGPNANHTYSQTGTYTVSFTFDPNGPCQQVQIFSVEVVDVHASFRTEPEDLFSCSYPFEVRFISTSIGENLTYSYNFDDNYMGFDGEMTHFYQENGRYTPTLTVSSPGGCVSRFTGPEIVVNNPEAELYSTSDGGCIPATVGFYNNSQYTDNSAVVDFYWNFGDGTSVHTTEPSVEHIYAESGIYNPTLTITDTSGCTATSSLLDRTSGIMTGTQVSPEQFGVTDAEHNFIPGDTVCPLDVVYLYNSMNEHYGEYSFFFVVNSPNYSWATEPHSGYAPYMFNVDTGWNKVGFMVGYRNCYSPVQLWDSIYVKPPIVHLSYYNDCSAPFRYSFMITENLGAEYWEWLIWDTENGDTLMYDPHSTTDSISITYPSYGNYECNLTAHNDGSECEYGRTVVCDVLPSAFSWEISSDTLCLENRLTAVVLYAPAFTEVAFDWEGSGQPLDELNWVTIDGITDDRHYYERGGDYDVIAYGRHFDGCISVFTKHLYVVDPQSDIIPDVATAGCVPSTIDFELVTHTNDSLYSAIWNFGDGSEAENGQNVSHTYNDAGTYNVSISVTTQHGCQFSTNFPDRIKIFETPSSRIDCDLIVCLGTEQTFSAESSGSSIWHEWHFADGTIASGTNATVTHQYEQAGSFDFMHVASIRNNGAVVCNDTTYYIIRVENIASVSFTIDSATYNCYPVSPTIHSSVQAEPNGTYIYYNWDMGNGDVLHVQNPRYLYTSPGTYNISLELTTPGGCSSTYSQTIEISGPMANISLSDTIVCAGNSVHFSMTDAVDVESFVWVVGGGDSYTNMPEVTHIYGYVPESGYFPVTLSLQNGDCTIDFVNQVYVYRISSDFSLVDSNGSAIGEGACPPLEGLLEYSASTEVTPRWFVNGVEQTENSVLWTNSSTLVDSLNVVSLTVTDSLGCVDSVSHQYLVYKVPDAKAFGDTLICKGGEAQISATGGSAYYWDLPIGDSAQIQNISPDEATVYYVFAFSEKKCMSIDSVMIDVMQAFVADIEGQMFTINMGDTAVSVIVADSGLECYVSPEEYSLSMNCDSIMLYPLENTDFTLLLKDSLGCYEKSFDIHVDVDMKLTLDVPSAFTPLSEGDGNNVVYVRGLGIKELRQFRIFNRWGEEVFFTDDLHTGWDGTIGGVVQNQDTYSYYVEAEMFDGSTRTKKGNIMLLK